jgi:diguanylate cyclase (GGDEF)-like protein
MRETEYASAGSTRDRLRDIQHEILEATASGRPLNAVMDLLCRRVEELDPCIICSVLSVDAQGFLHPIAAPSLPDSYSSALDGLPIGPNVGSCGTAAYRGEDVAVTDIENDPLWADYKALALPLGLRACWSSPIKARDNRVVGTFAFYYRCAQAPSGVERMIVATCVHLCAIAIEQDEARAKIHQLAFYDPVTGLPNRALFQQRAAEIFSESASAGATLAVHYLDLDDFKAVNDTLGHHIGDALLKEVGVRLTLCAGETDLVARLGGDEFAVVQRSARHRGDVHSLAAQLIEAVGQPFELCGQTVTVRASIGFTIVGEGTAGLDVLMRQADLAAYEAKGDGGGTYRMFDPVMFRRAMARRAIEQDLRRADLDREFELLYQPIMSLKTGELAGGEALIRWNHPERGQISPADFIPVAEGCGLMARLGDWIVRTACREAACWPAHVMLSVNISPMQLKRQGFALNVVRKLRDTGLSPHRLQFEITETALLNDANAARVILQQFKNLGIRIALDDFGTGYSSLSHLRSFPIDTIKIDRSFVREFGHGADSTAIIRAVLDLARDLGMTTTAEGIETAEQLAALAAAGCTHAQGYHLGKPMKRTDFEALIGVAELQMPGSAEALG